ncbi:hypothetical protein TRFO_08188 [Tritrichomonas foetus]|uniref:Uncharacterized protein n=1 Tax=Tritrichomonas foetus TaxID=1144522 RepID=A0A1J4JQT8_9EUKA|nr:hypothetical protein TRFO_08188 [Tritrichomonas foetus]|eukprot:OHS99883.1 hypothetical protein TRFO_08188 [Tritrichomonas foetus]
MHPNAARTLHLLYRAENALSPDALLADPFLSSRLALFGAIPVSDLLSENSILQMNPEQEELVEATKRSRILSVFPEKIDGEYFILPGFNISPNILILRQVVSLGSFQDLFNYLEMLCGKNRFQLMPVGNGMDYYALFQSVEECFSFWKSLKYVPYRGHFIKSEIYSPLLMRIVPQVPQKSNRSVNGEEAPAKHQQKGTQTPTIQRPEKHSSKAIWVTGQSKKNIVL